MFYVHVIRFSDFEQQRASVEIIITINKIKAQTNHVHQDLKGHKSTLFDRYFMKISTFIQLYLQFKVKKFNESLINTVLALHLYFQISRMKVECGKNEDERAHQSCFMYKYCKEKKKQIEAECFGDFYEF